MGNNRCYGCMRPLPPGQMVCPGCGHDNSRRMNRDMTLGEGNLLLGGKYLVGRVLGKGGFGITYLGLDTILGVRVAIKEYFPHDLCIREPGTANVKISSDKYSYEKYQHGKTSFEDEARTLAKFNAPGIVRVRDYFQQNNTTYIVMEYAEGLGLDEEIKRCGGRMDWQRVVFLMIPLMRDLYSVHQKQVIHRDIKPQNIIIAKDEFSGREHLVLLDFGAARNYVSSELSGTFTAILTQGYAPPEQYLQHTHLGPYTDIYSLCATMYMAISGTKPPSAPDRMYGDEQLAPFSEYGLNIPENVEKAIFHGMELKRQDRPQNLYQLFQEISARPQPNSESLRIYNNALRLMSSGVYEDLQMALSLFGQIPGYRNADDLAGKCRKDLDRIRENERAVSEKDRKYVDAKMYMERDTAESVQTAANLFREIPGWRDADSLLSQCLDKISRISPRNIEPALPETDLKYVYKYNDAKMYMEQDTVESLQAAADLFREISGWMDSDSLLAKCLDKLSRINEPAMAETDLKNVYKYNDAKMYMEQGTAESLQAAVDLFREIRGWRDADRLLSQCQWKLRQISPGLSFPGE